MAFKMKLGKLFMDNTPIYQIAEDAGVMGRANNKASAKVLEKADYQLEGILRKNKRVDGIYLDDFIYSKIK